MITEERKREIFEKEYISAKELKELFNIRTRQYASHLLKVIKTEVKSTCNLCGKMWTKDFYEYYKIKVTSDGDFKFPKKPTMPRERVFDGRKLRIARKKQGLKQSELSEKIGIGQKTISDYELNILNPPAKKIAKLSEALGVSPDYFLKDEILRKRKKENKVDD